MSDTGRLREVQAVQADVFSDNARRLGELAARGINVQIPDGARVQHLTQGVQPPAVPPGVVGG